MTGLLTYCRWGYFTTMVQNTFQSEGVILGSDEEEFKNVKKAELMELKKMLTRLATSIKSFEQNLVAFGNSCLMMSSSCLELHSEQLESASKGCK